MKEILKNKKQLLIHLLIWVSLTVIIFIQIYIQSGKIPLQLFRRVIINIIIFYINYSLLVPYLLLKKKKLFYFLSIIAILYGTYLLSSYGSPFAKVDINFSVPLKVPLVLPSIVLLVVSTAIRIYEEWNENERNKKEIELQKHTSELQNLKNQLNPHFFFNSLNSIYSLTTKKSNDAPEAVIMLSDLMRYMLYKANDDFVLLQQEMDYIQNYIKLQRLRLANNENVKINIRGTISNQKIRPLLFISFIENAFKYGTDFKGNTEIKIDISINTNELQFSCINLIGNRKKDKDSSGIGLKNTKERLQLLYPDKYWLLLNEEDNKYIVNLTLILD